MAECAVCGEEIARDPVWVVLGDKGERPANEKPFALHGKHYPKDGKVEVQDPITYDDEADPNHQNPIPGEKRMVQRYVKVKAPNG